MISKRNNEKKPKFAVLLAAKNGEKWINNQILSILSQKNVEVKIFISIDRSYDRTEEICKKLAKSNSAIQIIKQNNLKRTSSSLNFFWLIKNVDLKKFDYISLSDQDDIWFHDKLKRAIMCLKKFNSHGYSSNVIALYEDGSQKKLLKNTKQTKFDFLFESAGAGSTYVLKSKEFYVVKELITNKFKLVKKIENHDWFIYSCFRSMGYKWFIDKKPTMFYRQHNSNVIGANNSIESGFRRLKMILSKWYSYQVNQNYKIMSSIADKNRIFDVNSNLDCIINFYQLRRNFFHKIVLLILMITRIY